MTSRPPIFLLAGPTASGKSDLALRLAEAWRAEVVNADAIQLYRDLRVLSARPSPEEEARAPHHLFGVADAADGWSVGRWLRAAQDALDQIAGRGSPAVVVGGTGLYFRALTRGLAEVPAVPEQVRQETAQTYDRLGEAEFRERLAAFDPEAAARISSGDRQRLQRAWEVHAASGRALTDWQAQTTPVLAAGSWQAAVLEPPRDELYARCDARLKRMLDQGVLAEVEALMARRLDPDLPAMKAVGLREFASAAQGRRSLHDALAAAQQETRRYAKRQLTWLRNQTPEWPRIGAVTPEEQWEGLAALVDAR